MKVRSIKSLLKSKVTDEGVVTQGPFSQVFAANAVSKEMEFPYTYLASISFEDPDVNQVRDDGGRSGYDTLVMAEVYNGGESTAIGMFIDEGTKCTTVAMAILTAKENEEFTLEVSVSATYEEGKGKYLVSLEEDDLFNAFLFIYANFEQGFKIEELK